MAAIYGSFLGNITGTLYFLLFQITGVTLCHFILKSKNQPTRLLCGSVLGSVLLQWLPALFAFIFGFSITAHILALLSCIIIIALLYIFKIPHASFPSFTYADAKRNIKEHWLFISLCTFTFILFCIMLSSHTLLPKDDGLHTGQCTYGDMSMHLGFITSIARQQIFPPEYSISPGDKLCYPFLCDSISSSIYIFGASLRYSYMLPMYFAILQILWGFYLFACSWLKNSGKACLAWFFFFYNGGLAFAYFIDWSRERTYFLKSIFTEYYQTPTNLIDNNIRWVNIIVDMLLPQRATLFGYAVLFTCIWLLWRAVFNQEKDLFLITAVLTGSLPMIHTHSFLAMALISASWMLMDLYRHIPFKSKWQHPGKIVLPAFLIFMCILQFMSRRNTITPSTFLLICIAVLASLFCLGILCLIRYVKKNGYHELMISWGIYLAIILVLALPQLFNWTFVQTSSDHFNQGHFNWANLGDNYIWFYIKNWGIILLLLIPALIYSNRKNFAVLSAGFLIWFVIELVAFSPNTYDNNKLLYVAYIFFACISADYGCRLYHEIKAIPGMRLWRAGFLLVSGISAVLSMGREIVSDYTVYSNAQISAAIYIDTNLPKDAVFLTNDRHLNEAAVLAGRNIVNGAGIYLSPHGLYNPSRIQDVKIMYESPDTCQELFDKYSVDYLMVSSWERNSYQINEALFDSIFKCIFDEEGIKIYQVEFLLPFSE